MPRDQRALKQLNSGNLFETLPFRTGTPVVSARKD